MRKAKVARKPARRDTHDLISGELTRSDAVLMTAILALSGKGVYDSVSLALRGVQRSLERVREAHDELSKT